MKKKIILQCCFDCGKKYGKKDKKGVIGMWNGTCDLCGKEGPCASAPHDFGIYSTKAIEDDDKFQDLL